MIDKITNGYITNPPLLNKCTMYKRLSILLPPLKKYDNFYQLILIISNLIFFKTANKEEVSTTTPAKANKTNLSAAIARVQEAIANAGVTEKTASVIEDSKAELITAQALEASEVATQGEVDKATVELKNKAFVLESMKKATSDKKEEKVNFLLRTLMYIAVKKFGRSRFRNRS